jgi:hypothetical protein
VTARRPLALLGALVAALVLAFLAGLLFLARSRGARGPEPREPGPRSVSRETPAARGSAPAGRTSGAAPVDAPPPGTDKPGAYRLEGSARFEDGTPVPGVHFLELERAEDGSTEVSLDISPNHRVETGSEGTFVLSWPERPPEILLLVMCREAEVASVENGSLLGPDANGVDVAADGSAPLRLTMRWKAGTGLLRVRDPVGGRILRGRRLMAPPGVGGVEEWVAAVSPAAPEEPPVAACWRWPEGTSFPGVDLGGRGADAEGWFRVDPPQWEAHRRIPEGDPVLEILVEGFATARVPLERMRGRVEVTLEPGVPDLTGEVAVPGAPDPRWPVWGTLRPADPAAAPKGAPRGAIRETGPFRFLDLPDGRWTLEVWSMLPAGLRCAQRTFEKAGGPVDLGTLEVSAWSGFRVRAVDRNGRPMESPISVSRIGSEGSEPVMIRFLGQPRTGAAIVETRGVVRVIRGDGEPLEADSAGERPDAEGWMVVRGLMPGARYRLSVPSLGVPGVEAEAPETTGEIRSVEVRVEKRIVRCVLRFTVDGKIPPGKVELFGAAGPRDAGRGEGVWEVELPPGVRGLTVGVRSAGDGDFDLYQATLEVPDQDLWETTVDLK